MHYYTLSETPPGTRLTTPPDMVPVRLDRVTMPNELDRSQIVRRIDPTQVQILESDRWAAPLDDMIRRVLSDNLTARLPANLVADPNEPSVGEKRQSLSVDIQEFYGDTNCAVTLRVAWALKQPDSHSSRSNEEVRIPGGSNCSGAASLPAAMSRALEQLSDRIATAIARSPDSSAQQQQGH
jgi:uncharacterized protein